MNRSTAQAFALRLAPHAAAVANFCDHIEHNELTDRAWVLESGTALRDLACELSTAERLPVVDLFAERLGAIEARNVLHAPGTFDGHHAALQAQTWRQLQVVQSQHDRHYHPDVVGLTKLDQLVHYALHLAKIVGAFAEPASAEDLIQRRLPDTVLFGIKLWTVMGARLGDEPLPGRVSARQAAAGTPS